MAVQPCKGSFTNRPKYQTYIDDAHVDPRIVHEEVDNLLIFLFNSARDLGILHGKMHVISGRVDRLALLVCDSKFKSWCNIDHARIQKLLSGGQPLKTFFFFEGRENPN